MLETERHDSGRFGGGRFGGVAAALPAETRPGAARAAVRVRGGVRVIGSRVGGVVRCPAGSRREGYRLGRWERMAMTIVVVAAVVVAAVTLARPATASTRLVTVLPGDTMTSLVLREAPGMDVARAAEVVEQLNGLASPTVSSGMRLLFPAGR